MPAARLSHTATPTWSGGGGHARPASAGRRSARAATRDPRSRRRRRSRGRGGSPSASPRGQTACRRPPASWKRWACASSPLAIDRPRGERRAVPAADLHARPTPSPCSRNRPGRAAGQLADSRRSRSRPAHPMSPRRSDPRRRRARGAPPARTRRRTWPAACARRPGRRCRCRGGPANSGSRRPRRAAQVLEQPAAGGRVRRRGDRVARADHRLVERARLRRPDRARGAEAVAAVRRGREYDAARTHPRNSRSGTGRSATRAPATVTNGRLSESPPAVSISDCPAHAVAPRARRQKRSVVAERLRAEPRDVCRSGGVDGNARLVPLADDERRAARGRRDDQQRTRLQPLGRRCARGDPPRGGSPRATPPTPGRGTARRSG